MTGKAELGPELNRDPDVEAGPSVEAEDEDLVTHLKDLEDGTGCIEVWSRLSKSCEE